MGLTFNVSERQLRFFEHPKPLLQRFGADFFRAAPACPGVYIMSGEGGRVLYVGQSKNLRSRLATYKNAHPDHVSRKIIRLVHAVRQIVWEECATTMLAQVRENELLRTHRPKFNVVNTYPKAYCFVGVKLQGAELFLSLTTDECSPENFYGAFKRGSVYGYAALLRLLWAALHQPNSPYDFPRPLLSQRPPREFQFQLERAPSALSLPGLMNSLTDFFEGTSSHLIDWLGAAFPASERLSRFHETMQLADLETLTNFYSFGPQRNLELKKLHGIESRLIPQDQLDDLLAKAREAKRSAQQTALVSTPVS